MDITKIAPKNPGTIIPGTKKSSAWNAPGLVQMGFYQNPQITESQNPKFPQILKFQIRIFAILDSKQIEIKSQIVVFGESSGTGRKK